MIPPSCLGARPRNPGDRARNQEGRRVGERKGGRRVSMPPRMIETLPALADTCASETLGEGSQGTTFDGIDKRDGPRGRHQAVPSSRRGNHGRTWSSRSVRRACSRPSPTRGCPLTSIIFRGGRARSTLVMERIEGESLADLRKRGAVLAPKTTSRAASRRTPVMVLAYLHSGRRPSFTAISSRPT